MLDFFRDRLYLWALGGLIFLSYLSFLIFSDLNLVTTYNDSMSHLNLTRLIIDNQEPGISQLGGVWLPLSHLLPLVFIWNDLAWHSGFAGSIFSMAAYIFSAIFIFKIVKLLTGNKLASFAAGLAFALNLNVLYLQSTPLTECLYLVFFVASVYFILKWMITQNAKYLPLIGFCGFFQVLTRYDGWFVTLLQVLILFCFEFVYNRRGYIESFSKMLLVFVPIGFGIGIWLLWNLLIFSDPLFFAFGPYSAHAQQETISQSASLITKGNLALSVKAYYYTAINNVGLYVMTLGIFGSIVWVLFKSKVVPVGVRFLIFLLFLGPVIFNILALYLGFSILNIPELNWNPSNNESGWWFNVRYGILALPAVALLIGILSSRKVYLAIIAIMVIIFQVFATFNQGIITILDGTIGASAYRKQDISSFLKNKISKEDIVLLSTGFNNPVAFSIGVPLKNVIHEGVSKKWSKALKAPEKYADWIVISNFANGDPLHESLVENQSERLYANYDVEFEGREATVYKRKEGFLSSAHSPNP